MRATQFVTCLLALVLASLDSAQAEDRTVRLTSLEWPPYSGAELRAQGASSDVVRQAFAAMGYRLEIVFVPWSRAVHMARHDKEVVGYFPEYASPENNRQWTYSDAIGAGPLGLAQRRAMPLQWHSIEDLKPLRIGVVADYVNTRELDEMIARREIRADTAPSDLHNLQKLVFGRVDAAVIDPNVFDYLMNTAPQLAEAHDKLEMNPLLLEDKLLYVCFKPNADGRRLAAILGQGLRKISIDKIMATHIPPTLRALRKPSVFAPPGQR